jgi:acyl dehydratase
VAGPDPTWVGRVYQAAEPYQVGREKLREFARAVGATQPVFHDVAAAQALGYPDVVAAPTFAAVVAQRAEAAYVQDPAAGIDFTRVVHAEEALTHTRPIVAGDQLSTELVVESVQVRGALALVTTLVRITDQAGLPVSEVRSTLAVRGDE